MVIYNLFFKAHFLRKHFLSYSEINQDVLYKLAQIIIKVMKLTDIKRM